MSKLIVITGVSRGLGLAMTQGFATKGHTVLGCARSAESIAALRQQFGSPHRFETVDVSDKSQVQAWASQLLKDYPPPNLPLICYYGGKKVVYVALSGLHMEPWENAEGVHPIHQLMQGTLQSSNWKHL